MCFLHSTFLNRDFSLDIVRKCINIFTVLLLSVVEGSVSHFFDVGFQNIFMAYRKNIKIIFYISSRFT